MIDKNKEGEKRVSGLKTIIGKGTHIEGKVSIQSSGRVDGIIIGELISTETIVIGEDGDVKGDVISGGVVVGGRVKGNIYATERIVLESKSFVIGDLISPKVPINDGTIFNGSCRMMKSKEIIVDKKSNKVQAIDLTPEEILTSK